MQCFEFNIPPLLGLLDFARIEKNKNSAFASCFLKSLILNSIFSNCFVQLP